MQWCQSRQAWCTSACVTSATLLAGRSCSCDSAKGRHCEDTWSALVAVCDSGGSGGGKGGGEGGSDGGGEGGGGEGSSELMLGGGGDVFSSRRQ